MDNEMAKITSLKFDFIESNITTMLELLKNNQTFLRYVLNLNDFPLGQEYCDKDGISHPQLDYDEPYDLIGTQTVLLTLFNPTILQTSKVNLFFSPLKGTSKEGDPIIANKYVFDIIVPYYSMVINSTGKLRMFRIANEVCREWDNKYVAGIGKTIMYDWSTAPVDANYQGMSLYFKVDDSAFTDEEE